MAKEVVIDINVKTAKADKNVKNLNKDLQQTKKKNIFIYSQKGFL